MVIGRQSAVDWLKVVRVFGPTFGHKSRDDFAIIEFVPVLESLARSVGE